MRSIVYLANFLFSFAGAVTLYTNSSFIERTLGANMVSILYAVSAVISIIVLARAGATLKRIGNRSYFFGAGAVYALSLFLLVLSANDTVRIIALGAYLIATNAIIFSLNIFFRHLEPKTGRGNARGFFLLLGNTGIMLGPLLAARAIDAAGYTGMYALGLGLFAIVALVVYASFDAYKDPVYNFGHFETAVRHTLRTRTLRNVISANFILQFFYAWMTVYTPIYLFEYLHFSWDTIGIIFSVMLATFIILDYPLGRLADYLGSEKELAAFGFLLMAASVFSLALLNAPTALTVGALLFLSRIGAATVEAMTEIHFFKVVKDADPGLLSLFCDLRPLSYIAAPIIGAFALALLPFQMTFAVLGIILVTGFVVAFYLEKDTRLWARAHE